MLKGDVSISKMILASYITAATLQQATYQYCTDWWTANLDDPIFMAGCDIVVRLVTF